MQAVARLPQLRPLSQPNWVQLREQLVLRKCFTAEEELRCEVFGGWTSLLHSTRRIFEQLRHRAEVAASPKTLHSGSHSSPILNVARTRTAG